MSRRLFRRGIELALYAVARTRAAKALHHMMLPTIRKTNIIMSFVVMFVISGT